MSLPAEPPYGEARSWAVEGEDNLRGLSAHPEVGKVLFAARLPVAVPLAQGLLMNEMEIFYPGIKNHQNQPTEIKYK